MLRRYQYDRHPAITKEGLAMNVGTILMRKPIQFILLLSLLLCLSAAPLSAQNCGSTVFNVFSGKFDCLGVGSYYTATFSGQTGVTVTATTHGQGVKVMAWAFDNATPANL